MMLGIEVNGGFLELKMGKSVKFSLINPLFDKDGVPRVYSQKFNVDATPVNQELLNYAHRLDMDEPIEKYKAVVWLGGVPYEEGFLYVSEPTDISYSIFFEGFGGDFATALNNLNLRDLDLGTFSFPAQNATRYTVDWAPPTAAGGGGQVRIYADGVVIGATLYTGASVTATVLAWARDRINTAYPGAALINSVTGLLDIDFEGYGLVELIFWANLSASEGYWVNKNVYLEPHSITDAVLEGIAALEDSQVFPTIKNSKFYNNSIEDYGGYVNWYQSNRHQLFMAGTPNRSTICPMARLHKVIEAIAENNDYYISGAWLEDDEIKNLLLYSTVSLDKESYINYINNNGHGEPQGYQYRGLKEEYKLAKTLSDKKAKELWRGTKDLFSLAYLFNEDNVEVVRRDDLLNSEIIDWTQQSEHAYKLKNRDGRGFKMCYKRDDSDSMIKENQLESLMIGNDVNDYEFDIDSPYIDSDTENNRLMLLPHTIQTGNGLKVGDGNDFGLRVLWWRGFIDDAQGMPYPFATHGNIDRIGNIIGNYSLEFSGQFGLYETHWKRWADLVNNPRLANRNILLDVNDIRITKEWKTPRRRIWGRNGEMVGVIERIDFSVKDFSILQSKVKFYLE